MVGVILLRIHVIVHIPMTMVTNAPIKDVYRDVWLKVLLAVMVVRALVYATPDIGDRIVNSLPAQTTVITTAHVTVLPGSVTALMGSSAKTALRLSA